MSCKACEENPITGAFYRWKNANIEIIGCREHIKEVMEALQLNSTSTDIEELKKEFEKKFNLWDRKEGEVKPFSPYGGTVQDITMKKSMDKVWNFFAPHLSNKIITNIEGSEKGYIMYRPKWEDIKIGGCVQCTCGHILQTRETTREHWQMGHLDVPHLSNKSELKKEAVINAVREFIEIMSDINREDVEMNDSYKAYTRMIIAKAFGSFMSKYLSPDEKNSKLGGKE